MTRPRSHRSREPQPATPSGGEVTLKDVWASIETKFNGLEPRVRRLELGLVLIAAAVVSPKVGGPAPDKLIASALKFVGG